MSEPAPRFADPESAPGTLGDWLRWGTDALAEHSDEARTDAEVLLAEVVGCERTALRSRADEALDTATVLRVVGWIERRKLGEPVAYITARRGFWTLDLVVDTAVLIPRPDTETLVEWALALLPKDTPTRVLDLGTGSGAIALAIARERPQAQVIATDISQPALDVATENAQRNGVCNVEFRHGAWFEALRQNPLPPGEGRVRASPTSDSPHGSPCPHPRPSPGGRGESPVFDLIVSNPPYVAEGDAHLAALRYEPRLALTSGLDGLDAIRHLVANAPSHLRDGGALLLEHGADQGAAVRALLLEAGFADVTTRRDLGGHERVSGGVSPPR